MSKRKAEREEKFTNLKQRKKKKKESITNPCKTDFSKKKISSNWLSFVKSHNLKITTSKGAEETSSKMLKKPAVTKVVAVDCEMVADENDRDMLARVSLVNFKLECIYDEFVKTQSPVVDYRTRFSGIRPADLEKGKDFNTVRSEVKNLIFNRILVGHALSNDFNVLRINHHKKLIRDTSRYEPFKKLSDNKTPALKKLAKEILNENIQEGEHSSVEDAKTAMKLYKKFRKEWETSLANQIHQKPVLINIESV